MREQTISNIIYFFKLVSTTGWPVKINGKLNMYKKIRQARNQHGKGSEQSSAEDGGDMFLQNTG
jgi:hypothetical protein